MNKGLILLAAGCMLVSFLFGQCAKGQKSHEIVLTNTSSIALTDKAITIKRTQLPGIPKGKADDVFLGGITSLSYGESRGEAQQALN